MKPKRYDPAALLAQLEGQIPLRDGRTWRLEFQCADAGHDVEDFSALLPDSQEEHPRALTVLRDFLANIDILDELTRTADELDIAFIDLQGDLRGENLGDGVRVTYWGTHCNTDWDAVFKRTRVGEWRLANPE